MSGAFRALVAADGLLVSRDDEIVDAVLERAGRLDAEEAPHIRLVLAEEEIARLVDGELSGRPCRDGAPTREPCRRRRRSAGFSLSFVPRPDVAGPELRQKVRAAPLFGRGWRR